MKLNVKYDTMIAALASLKVRALDAQALGQGPKNKWQQAYDDLTHAAQGAVAIAIHETDESFPSLH